MWRRLGQLEKFLEGNSLILGLGFILPLLILYKLSSNYYSSNSFSSLFPNSLLGMF